MNVQLYGLVCRHLLFWLPVLANAPLAACASRWFLLLQCAVSMVTSASVQLDASARV